MNNKTKVRIKSVLWLIFLVIISLIWWSVVIMERKINNNKKQYFYLVKMDYKKLIKEIKETFYSIKSGKKEWI